MWHAALTFLHPNFVQCTLYKHNKRKTCVFQKLWHHNTLRLCIKVAVHFLFYSLFISQKTHAEHTTRQRCGHLTLRRETRERFALLHGERADELLRHQLLLLQVQLLRALHGRVPRLPRSNRLIIVRKGGDPPRKHGHTLPLL